MKTSLFRSVTFALVLCAILGLATPAAAQEPTNLAYGEAIQRTEMMVNDDAAQQLAFAHDLQILNVSWEDTGRYQDSSVGPNISDVTIQVQSTDPRTGESTLALMPVIRHPNFSDVTADISPDQFFVLVGNHADQPLERISLTEYLGNFPRYLSKPESWAGDATSLLAERDTHVLVSAQAAFLPVPSAGLAQFNPVIFNYQSYPGDPAVLTIVATREGTSATVIDNQRDGFDAGWSWGQRLFFNHNGERASFTGQRISDFSAINQPDQARQPSVEAAGEGGLNTVLIIQVPLKQKNPPMAFGGAVSASAGAAAPAPATESDVEAAVIGHGAIEGPFTEIDGLTIERDDRFPVRVTVQFYKATSNGAVSASDLQAIAAQIDRVYRDADYVGSLVVDGDSRRPTVFDGSKIEPMTWWSDFWQHFEQNLGMNREQAIQVITKLRMNAGRMFAD